MKRITIYVLIIIAGFLLQVTEFPIFSFFLATPNILLIMVFSFGFMKGRLSGMLAGFLAGILLDFFYGEHIGFFALIYMIIGYVNGIGSRYYYDEYIHLPLALCIINELVLGLYVYTFRFLIRNRLDIGYYFMKIVMPELIFSVVITLLFYRFLLYINKRIERKEKERS